MGGIEGTPAQGGRHPPPSVIEATDAGAPFEHRSETGRVAALHVGTQMIERRSQLAFKTLKAGGTCKAQKVLPAHGIAERDEGLRSALQPEIVFNGKRQDRAIGSALDEARDAGLEAERTFTHVTEASLRGNP